MGVVIRAGCHGPTGPANLTTPAAAAKRFFRKALSQPHTVNPRTITVDKNPAYPCAVTEMKADGELWRFSRLRQVKYLTDVFDKLFFEGLCESMQTGGGLTRQV